MFLNISKSNELVVNDPLIAAYLIYNNCKASRQCEQIITKDEKIYNFYFEKNEESEKLVNNFVELDTVIEVYEIRDCIMEHIDEKAIKLISIEKNGNQLIVDSRMEKSKITKFLKRM